MLSSSVSLTLDDGALEFLVHRLTLDRSIHVAECLPEFLNEITRTGAEPCTRPGHRAERKERWECASVSLLAEILSRALTNDGTPMEWREAEIEWNRFLQGSKGLQKMMDAESTKESLRELLAPAAHALAPLLSFLLREASNKDEKIRLARGFYSRVMSSLIRHDASFSSTGCGSDVWTMLHGRNAEFYDLLQPFIESEIEPLEKELIFHFQKNSKTAHREEPQHFFSFVLDLYKRLTLNLQTNGWMLPIGQSGSSDMVSPCILAIGDVSLALTAISVFRSSYEWHAGSESLEVMDFTTHGVNAFIDFISMTEGLLHRSAQRLFVESVLPPSVIRLFLDAVRSCAEGSFLSGDRALWRMEFLYNEPSIPSLNFIRYKTHHMIRCLEAVVRRLSHVFCILPMYTVSLWERVLSPCLSLYVSTLESVKGGSNSHWEEVLASLELLSCAHVIHSAAEEWTDRCQGVSGGGGKNLSTSLDNLSLWRDALTREVVGSIKTLATQVFCGRGYLENDFHAWNTILGVFHQPNRITAHAIVYDEIKICMSHITTGEQRGQLLNYCHAVGLKNVSRLLEDISASS